jgi:hypothetical protein
MPGVARLSLDELAKEAKDAAGMGIPAILLEVVDLDDPIEVADIDPQFQGRGCHDDAIAAVSKGRLCIPPLFGAQRTV